MEKLLTSVVCVAIIGGATIAGALFGIEVTTRILGRVTD